MYKMYNVNILRIAPIHSGDMEYMARNAILTESALRATTTATTMTTTTMTHRETQQQQRVLKLGPLVYTHTHSMYEYVVVVVVSVLFFFHFFRSISRCVFFWGSVPYTMRIFNAYLVVLCIACVLSFIVWQNGNGVKWMRMR